MLIKMTNPRVKILEVRGNKNKTEPEIKTPILISVFLFLFLNKMLINKADTIMPIAAGAKSIIDKLSAGT